MNAYETIDLAARLVRHCADTPANDAPFSESCLADYWFASRARFDAWHRSLEEFDGWKIDDLHDYERHIAYATYEEILVSEVLTQVFAARLSDVERRNTIASIAEQTVNAHFALRLHVLRAIAETRLLRPNEAWSLNRLRQRVESWTDRLVESSRDDRRQTNVAPWIVVTQAVKLAYRPFRDAPSPSEELNARVASSVCQCLGLAELTAPC